MTYSPALNPAFYCCQNVQSSNSAYANAGDTPAWPFLGYFLLGMFSLVVVTVAVALILNRRTE